jgi:septal ring factor EnvC (AmiA/AmiB activator)|tara:strand:- start:19 stop:330 length:312 start_codon:yes stop_codon:yes gene_type:complete
MEFIKKSWKVIVGLLGFIISMVWFMNANSNRKVKKIKKSIKSNEKKTKEVQNKVKRIKKDKKVTKKKISETDKQLKEIRNKKPVVKKKTGKDARASLKKRLKK